MGDEALVACVAATSVRVKGTPPLDGVRGRKPDAYGSALFPAAGLCAANVYGMTIAGADAPF